MAISFNEIPDAWRVPSVLVEFDNSQAMQGATLQEYCVLLAGQKLPAGTAESLKPYAVTSAESAALLFGQGSQLAGMCAAYLKSNSVTRMKAIAMEDDESAVAAAATITFTGAVIAPAPVNLYIGGVNVRCAASTAATAQSVAVNLAAAVNVNKELPVIASAQEGIVTLTCKNKGEEGNNIYLHLSYYDETLPTGLGIALSPFSGGAGNPDASALVVAMADDWYHVIAWPWLDRANLRVLEDELDERWGPLRHIDGVAICSKRGTYAELTTFGMEGDQGNYEHIAVVECCNTPDNPWERAARVAGVCAYYGNIDPARPFQTLPLKGSLAPRSADQLTQQEQNLLLFSGIATTYVDEGGEVRIQRLITNYRTSPSGAPDMSYLDVNTMLTLSYLRYDFRARLLRKYPRHKLASDNMQIAAGQAIMTPKAGKAEAIAAAMDWQELGLVENIDAFKKGLICERDVKDPNRLNWRLTPDIVNQFRVGAVQIQFRLQEGA